MKATCKSSKEKLDSILEYIIIHIVRATAENFHRQSRRTSKRFQEGKKRNRTQGLKSQETSLGSSKIIQELKTLNSGINEKLSKYEG